MRRLLLTAGFALLALTSTAQAATHRHRPGLDCQNVQTMTTQWLCEARSAASHPAQKRVHRCKPGYHRKTVWTRRHHKRIRQTRCVRVKPKATTPAPTLTLAAPTAVRAGIDPSYTQDPADNLKVTWTYSASSTDVPLPAGTLSLTVQEPNKAGSSGGCTMNVGDSITGGTCTQELPHYGSWNVTVSYTGASTTIAPASSTETEDIEPLPVPPPPPPAPITVAKAWGTDAPSSTPTISAIVKGSTAAITVTDDNYEGATSLTITDNLGDGCNATIAGTQATCAMPVTGTPSAFTVGYPGGTSTTTTVGQQATITTWPADSVRVSNPSVTVQQATVVECGYGVQHQVGDNEATCSYGSPVHWQNPIMVGTATRVSLYAATFGSLPSDRDPMHGGGYVSGYLTFTIAGGVEGTDYTATDTQYGPDNGPGCSKVLTQQWLGGDPSNNGPDEPAGSCQLLFNAPGTYTVTVSYTSEDPNYSNAQLGYTETISVT